MLPINIGPSIRQKKFAKKDLLIGLLLSSGFLFLIFFSLPLSPINTRGEGREGQVVEAMQRTGNIVLPLRNSSIVPSKPPLYHWVTYSISKLTGKLDPFELRLTSSLAGALILASTYLFLISQTSTIITFLSISIVVSSLEFMRYSTQGRVDMVFSCAFLFSNFFLFFYLKEIGNRNFILLLCSSALCLSVLAKGPFGLILPGLAIFTYYVFEPHKLEWKKIFWLLTPFLIAGLVASVWYFAAYKEFGEDFINIQIKKENLSRVLNDDSEGIGHGKPFFFSLIYLLQVMLPWSIFLPRIINTFDLNRIRESFSTNGLFRYFIITVFIFIAAVTVSVSKRSVYFLPVVPAISYILACLLLSSNDKKINRLIIYFEKTVLLIILAIVSIVFFGSLLSTVVYLIKPNIVDDLIRNIEVRLIFTNPLFVALNFILLIFTIKSLIELVEGRFENFILRFSISTFTFFLGVQYFIAPVVLERFNPQEFSQTVNQYLSKGYKIFQLEDEFYPPVFYLTNSAPLVYISDINKDTLKTSLFLAREKDFRKLHENNYQEIILETSEKNLASRKEKLYLISIE